MAQLPAALDDYNLTRWSDKFVFEIALALEGSGEPIADILTRHNLTQQNLLDFTKDPQFQKRIEAYQKDIVENGLTFKLKARAQAEDLLATSYLLIHDGDVPANVKADLIKATVRWAGLEPKNTDPSIGEAGRGVSITINMGPPSGSQEPEMRTVIDGRATQISED